MRDIVYEELQRLFRSYKHKVRRIDQFRPKANVRGRPKLRKADYTTGTDLWDVFADRMQERLLNALTVGAISIHSIMAARWPDTVLEIDSEAIARQLQSGIGTMVTRVSKAIKRQVGRKIVGWYNTPGASMQTIVKQLMPTFDLTRAELIARTEITRLDSLVTEQIAQKIEATEWWWMTLRDQLVCTRNLTGPDGKTYAGCRALHGKTFKVGQPMPPDGSHIGCRCKAILIAPVSGTSRSTEPIIDLSHLTKADFEEDKHPRDEDGKFTDKGSGAGKKTLSDWYKPPKNSENYGAWLNERFDFKHKIDEWGLYESNNTISIRDSYVVNDKRTLKNNASLRDGNPPTNWAYKIDTLMTTTMREDGILYRAALLDEKTINKMVEAGGFIDRGFMSTAGDRETAEIYASIRENQFKNKIPCIFTLKTKAGQNIGIMDIGEFVLPRDTKIVIHGSKMKDGKCEIDGSVE